MPHRGPRLGFMRRGGFKYLVLSILKEKPMHGYQIMKAIGEKSCGFYVPSPGIVYPTLEMLHDMGHVKMRQKNGKKVYTITPKGLKILEEKGDIVGRMMKMGKEGLHFDRLEFLRSVGEISRLIASNYDELSDKKIGELKKIIKDTRAKIREALLEEDNT